MKNEVRSVWIVGAFFIYIILFMRISIFKNIKTTVPLKDTGVYKVLEAIKSGQYKKDVASIRIESEKQVRNELKSKLPYVTFCGTFSSRSNSNLKTHSGLACLDFDDVEQLENLRELINLDSFTFASFVSPSGDGLKVLVKNSIAFIF